MAYASTPQCNGLPIVGHSENVVINNVSVRAKIDTGAAMSSISARDIQTSMHDQKTWMTFTVDVSKDKSMTLMAPLMKYTKILNRAGEQLAGGKTYTLRPVISLPICLGNQKKEVLVNLADRTQFQYPLLIGESALKQFHVVVDVTTHDLNTPSCDKY